MQRLVRAIATVGGIGYLPIAPGTAGSFLGLFAGMAWAMLWPWHSPLILRVLVWGAIALLGVIVSTAAEQDFKTHDPPCVVIDELIGMWTITVVIPKLLAIPVLVAVAFVVFRLVDILKLPPLKSLGRLGGGWGIMLDDLGAAAYTCLALWVVMRTP